MAGGPAPGSSWIMHTPYASLTPSQVAAARALVASPRWVWGSHTAGLRADGALVEFMPGRAYSRERAQEEGLLPLLTDPNVLGHLLMLLEAACGPAVQFSMGRSEGEGALVYQCALSAGTHRRAWEGTCLGEAVAQALVARWRATERPRPPVEAQPPAQSWAQVRMARVAAEARSAG